MYDSSVDCKTAIIFYQRLIDSSCNTLREPRLVYGSVSNGILCSYKLPCNIDDVICTLELMLGGKTANLDLSVCEIM